MKELDQIKSEIRSRLIKSHKDMNQGGGQRVSICHSQITVYSPDLDISIVIGTNRSQLKNVDLAYTLMDLAIDELIK